MVFFMSRSARTVQTCYDGQYNKHNKHWSLYIFVYFQVDSVQKSVDHTHTITEQINKQMVGPITSANTALQLMSQTRQILVDEKQVFIFLCHILHIICSLFNTMC